MNHLIVYSPKSTDRLSYIVELIFDKLLGCQTRITNSVDDFTESDAVQINYSINNELPGYLLKPSGLLFEKEIRPIKASLGNPWKSVPSITLDDSNDFDILSSSFYLVSRYEEYLPFEKDDHNRFTADQSCLTALGLLERPLVNEWALALLADLSMIHPNLNAVPRQFQFLSTIDIDQAWKYRNKGLIRNIGGLLRDAIKADWDEVKERLSVFLNDKEDVFFNFDWQDEIHQQYNLDVQYFIQVGSRGKFDKNTDLENPDFQQLIKRLDAGYSIGIHPSYQSNYKTELVRQEHHALENVVAHDISVSRQHFLMHEMPHTYQRLIDSGITQDHTMGYSTHLGFRAGVAAPFQFFDLTKNKSTKLTLVPFCCMDITPLHYMEQSQRQAVDTIQSLMKRVYDVGGMFVSLWHNESLSENGRWVGWRTVYQNMISIAYDLTYRDNDA